MLIDDNIVAQVSADDGAVVAAAVDRVDLAYARLERKGLTVINCDLWHDNIKVLDEELAPFDFEDTVFGHRIHDVAMALLDPATLVGIDEYERLLAHFHRGYESVRALPDGDGLDFQVGRMFWQLNWLARSAGPYFPRAAKFRMGTIRRALTAVRLSGPLQP